MNFFLYLLISVIIFLVFFVLRLRKTITEIKVLLKNLLSEGELKLSFHRKTNVYEIFLMLKELEDRILLLKATLNEKERVIEKIFYSLPIPIAFFSKDGKLEFKNYSFEKNFGKIEYLEDLKNLLRDENFYNIAGSLDEDGPRKIEIDWKDRNYSVDCEIIKTQEGISYLFTFLDITEIKKSQKIKAEFASNVSHELKTPITVIKGFIETLETEVPEDKVFMVKTIKKHIERLQNLVSDILLLDMVESGKNVEIKVFDLNETVSSAISLLEKTALSKNIMVFFEPEEEKLEIEGDNFLILQAIINILSNAIKFTPQSGTVTIKTYLENDKAFFSCKDTGIGIPEHLVPRIFERFFVIDKSRSRQMGGTGLGLSIVKHIVELHRGKIYVKSDYGRGTEFKIELPAKISKS